MGEYAFMSQIAAELAGFTKPALLAWAVDDKHFPLEHARRLAGILPDARLELIQGSRTWVMRDQPQRTAHLIGRLARRAVTTQTTTVENQGQERCASCVSVRSSPGGG